MFHEYDLDDVDGRTKLKNLKYRTIERIRVLPRRRLIE